jgi:hypothetical protein
MHRRAKRGDRMSEADAPVVPIGHYLGPVYDGAGPSRHRVRVGRAPVVLASDAEAAIWLAAHGWPEEPGAPPWTRQRILDAVAVTADPGAAFDALLAAGLLAVAGPDFPDRYRLMPLTVGAGVQPDGAGFVVGTGDRAVAVDDTVFRVWECAGEHPTLRAACAAVAAVAASETPPAAGTVLDAVRAGLHGLLAVDAAYLDVAD